MAADMTFDDAFLTAKKESEKSLPKARHPHESGLAAACYSFVGIVVFYIILMVHGPAFVAGIAGMVSAYLVARYDSNLEWSRHAKHFTDAFERESDDNA
tara:strand:+ start:13136 stop:13432 length:297 start_codon:yes stop_codon:yes gene_type:complete